MIKNMLISLGGNAILKHTEKGTAEQQFENVKKACRYIVELIQEGYHIALTHGNGPQVGDILLAYESAKNILPPMPLDVCGAQSQGMIGYMLQLSLKNLLKSEQMEKSVVTMLTQTIVHKDDPHFQTPTKPVGPFYTAMEATKLRDERGWTIINDSGRGYRRVVSSPQPIGFVEGNCIKTLFEEGSIVIASGGGGIPVILNENGTLKRVEAVIDKDHAASILALLIEAEILLILTDVENVALNYGKPGQKSIIHMTNSQAKKYLKEGQFPSGSMGPKVKSALNFLENGGEKVIITSLERALDSLKGNAGTTITI
jgi:carbamate kinase